MHYVFPCRGDSVEYELEHYFFSFHRSFSSFFSSLSFFMSVYVLYFSYPLLCHWLWLVTAVSKLTSYFSFCLLHSNSSRRSILCGFDNVLFPFLPIWIASLLFNGIRGKCCFQQSFRLTSLFVLFICVRRSVFPYGVSSCLVVLLISITVLCYFLSVV